MGFLNRVAPGNIVAVLAKQQGSGVLIGPNVVLTCAHILGAPGMVRIAIPRSKAQTFLQVAWSDPELDVAFLYTPGGPKSSILASYPQLSIADPASSINGCSIIGYPTSRLEAQQYAGAVRPGGGLLRHSLLFEFDEPPTGELSGLAGAPVVKGKEVLGIVRTIRQSWGRLRVECIPLKSIVTQEGFLDWYNQMAAAAQRPQMPTLDYPQDPKFEDEYAKALGAAYRKTKIFGLDELDRLESEWDLETAYLSLEAQPKETAPAEESAPDSRPLHDNAPARVEALLRSRPRVLLRGDAGAGKTTLVWRLAAQAAAGTLSPQLTELNGMVPFVVPLRTLRSRGLAFPAPAQLPTVARLVVDEAPLGWAERVLEAGRALLLVDGLDEVPQDDRDEAHRWLSELLERYPETRCLATVRPLAVAPDWLKSAGFEELRLLPMRDEDIQEFTAAWHRAAQLSDDDQEGLPDLERDLAQQFGQNGALRDLARTPLLCAVICALHRQRQGFLPETRWMLYQSALAMLLGNRDKQRRIAMPEGIDMSVEEHQQLLQRIAVWLVRGGQSEFSREQAGRQLAAALAGMERVRLQGSADAILTHLLNRSGLLQERADDVYQFIHRTFQDFLAAKEFVEDDHVSELVLHADEETWQDVVLLAAGHCSRREVAHLVNGLLDAEDPDLSVLAALCAQHAAWLDGKTAERIRERVTATIPPKNYAWAIQLSRLGAWVLPLLPEPEGLSSAELFNSAALIGMIGGSAAIPHAHAVALHAGSAATNCLASDWPQYDAEQYAVEVLAHLDFRDGILHVNTREQLAQVHRLSPIGCLIVDGDFASAELSERLRAVSVGALRIRNNTALTDLDFLTAHAESLNDLTVDRYPRLDELLTHVRRMPMLTSLHLSVRSCGELAEQAQAPGLVELTLAVDDWSGALDAVPHVFPHLADLALSLAPGCPPDVLDLTPLRRLPGLTIDVRGLDRDITMVVGHELFGDRLSYSVYV
ncbi:NACHT domain-containing protein [Streptomyces sp. NPDC051907]|uniref:NACHT domain-containing protein n=1 Tax=Streptomyces sp. NPDC051907 TaxID=3155284 RepID=UPI00341AE56D